MKCYFCIILFYFILKSESTTRIKDWYEYATMYQIYPRSFMDSDRDGVGDLKGITSKLTHLQDIGVNTIWMSPIFQSPQFDFGYDISDFTKIHDEYGTLEDFDAMMTEIKRLRLRILLDFVPNHSSHEHEWFIKSSNREKGYENYYIWHNGTANPNGDQPLVPNNWVSVFGGSAWTWHEKRKQYYLHQFLPQQPDLNYRERKVVAAMEEVLLFWLDKGVDGFRFDAINHMFEDETFQDEPENGGEKGSYDSLDHIYTKDLPEVYDFIYDCRELLNAEKNKDPKIIMTEAYASIHDTMRYYQSIDGLRQGAQMPFNFGMIFDLDSNSNGFSPRNAVNKWLDYMPPTHTPNWVLSSHDHSRTVSRVGEERFSMFYTLIHTLPGTSITYYGEEIGMVDNNGFQPNDSRDPCRTPMQWNDSTNAGFSSAEKTWLPVNSNYKSLNVEAQKKSDLSHYNHFKKLTKLRSDLIMVYGDYNSKVISDNVFAFTRELQGNDTILVLFNFGDQEITTDASDFVNLKEDLIVEIVNSRSGYKAGDVVKTKNITLTSLDGLVLRSSKWETNASKVIAKSFPAIFLLLLTVYFV